MTDLRTRAAWVRPASLDDAFALLAEHGEAAHVFAGGTSIALLRRQGLIEPELLVDVAGLPELTHIGNDATALTIGSMCTLRRVEIDPLVRAHAPVLAEAVGRVATIRIRNQATLGGNLVHADPAQDPPPILLALDAGVELAGPGGTRTVPLDEFFVDVFETVIEPTEILTRVRVPALPAGARATYVKFLPRTADDYATVSVAARLDLTADGRVGAARLAVGAAAAVPLRIREAEALLTGRSADEIDYPALGDIVRGAVDPVDDVRGSADYKRDMAGLWATRAISGLLTGREAAA